MLCNYVKTLKVSDAVFGEIVLTSRTLPEPLKATPMHLRLQSPPNLPGIAIYLPQALMYEFPHVRCSHAVHRVVLVVARRLVLGYRLEGFRRLLDESVIISVLAERCV